MSHFAGKMTGLALAIVINCLSSVLSYEVAIFDFSADLGLSGFLYDKSIIKHYVNLDSVMTCAALCGQNKDCLAYSYNTEEKFCRIYKEIFCTTAVGAAYKNTFFYVNPGKVGVVGRVNMQCKITDQSSTGLPSSRAIDGLWLTKLLDKSCSKTKEDNYPWWWIDLVFLYKVHSVVVLNRAGGELYKHLSKVQVYVGMTLKTLVLCGYREKEVPRGSTSTIACKPTPVKGRFIKIRLKKKSTELSMCEVAVNAEHVLS